MADIDTALLQAMTIDGAIGAALADYDSGLTLGVAGGGPDRDMTVAAAGNTDVLRAELRTLEMIGSTDTVEDVLITLDTEYHLLRPLRSTRSDVAFFLYLVLAKSRANLGLARVQLRRIEADLQI
ncbi:hypothetical protein [Actinoplanes sp. N902-109]|uniref:hypothetical protein n=1 Tax=Actinoplanes sp. (strain N902-109) TaxID=649831 RepID=UPI00032962BB|nr:hypothetical protein [Actinoplanes sp. N902-109]AGL17196.1 hypothetical protein L083_3686 [Actinoplanes sp. N902-109]